MKKITNALLRLVFLGLFFNSHAQDHPFLIVTEDMYPAIRQKANSGQQPFTYIKNSALQRWNNNTGNLNERFSYCIIAYMLETNATTKANIRGRVLNLLNDWKNQVPSIDSGSHASYVSKGTSTQFNAIIALDLIHNDLTAGELATAEQNLAVGANYFLTATAGWKLSGYGVNLLYALYKKDEAAINNWKQKYDDYLFDFSITDDGSWGQSTGYIYARLLTARIAKTATVDVLQFTGRGNYYANPQLVGAYEWGATFAVTPWGGYTKFGDTGLKGRRMNQAISPHFASQYGNKIGSYYSWLLGNDAPASYIPSNFLIMIKKPLNKPTPIMPKSALRTQSGAALWDRTDSQDALQGILYSLKRSDPNRDQFTHDLFDVNSFDLIGYGEHFVMNSGVEYKNKAQNGFNYPGYAPDGERWHRAKLHNTVLIGNNNEHNQRDGGGLTDGLTGGNIEFGTTAAGHAINNGSHKRTMSLVHPIAGNSHGYFVIHDEVTPNNPNDKVDINFQVNTRRNQTNTVTVNQEYKSPVNAAVLDANNTSDAAILFFGSNPNVNIVTSWKGGFDMDEVESDNIKATYYPAADGVVRATTVVFPEDATHQKPVMAKINNANYTGVKLTHNTNFIDNYVGANPGVESTYDGVTFKSSTTFFRKEAGNITSFCSANGTKFLSSGYGYTSVGEVSIQMEGVTGFINANSTTNVTFYNPFLAKIKIDGTDAAPVANFADAIVVNITEGRHTIELISEEENAKFVTPQVNEVENNQTSFDITLDYTTTVPGQRVIIDLKDPNGVGLKRFDIAQTQSAPETKSNFVYTADISDLTPLTNGSYSLDLFIRSNNIDGGGTFRGGEAQQFQVINSSTLNVDDFKNQERKILKIDSNPVAETLKINSEEVDGLVFNIFSITGKPINSGVYNNSIDVATLQTGIYFLKIGKGVIKFVKK